MRAGCIGIALLAAGAAFALEIPAHTGLVVDQAGVLDPAVRNQLEGSLRQFQRQYGPQIQLLTIPSLEGETIEDYSIRVADAWKVGSAKEDNGVILLVVPKDRQMRIEVGKGLEGDIPDVIAGRIINGVIAPYFKEGRTEAGIVAGLQAIAHRAGGELTDAPVVDRRRTATSDKESTGFGLFPIFILLFLILPMFRRRRARRSGLLGGWILGSMMGGRGSWGGGQGGWGGGFGGGGGGGFNGGGASGRW